MNANTSTDSALQAGRERVEAELAALLRSLDTTPPRLVEAMGYSLMAGGKRLRPVLALAAARAAGGAVEQALPVALAVELVHTYSLIHDDLPAMDDDDLRRGKPTSHKVFGEDVAILAGDALLTLAFEVLTAPTFVSRVGASTALAATREVARAAGGAGMVGGQILDIGSDEGLELPELRRLHELKTGALLRAATVGGGIAAGAAPDTLAALRGFGEAIGVAFQIVDDVLDVTASTETLGKTAGSDARNGKTTYVTLLGLEGCRHQIASLTAHAHRLLAPFGERARVLHEIADFIGARPS